MAHNGTGLNISVTFIWKYSKLSSYSFLKNMSKIPILDLNKIYLFFFPNFALNWKSGHFSNESFDILTFCNIPHLEMNFRNLH